MWTPRAIALTLLLGCGSQESVQAPASGQATPVFQAPAASPSSSAAPASPAKALEGPAVAGGLTWTAVAPLVARPPKSQMRAAEYAVAGAGPEDTTELTVHYFGAGQGGSVQANLDRWIGQFSQPDGKPSSQVAKIDKRTVGSLEVTTLDLSGVFSGGMGPMAPRPAQAKGDHRVLGAIVAGPRGPVFFKLVGPQATVALVESAFIELIDSLRPLED